MRIRGRVTQWFPNNTEPEEAEIEPYKPSNLKPGDKVLVKHTLYGFNRLLCDGEAGGEVIDTIIFCICCITHPRSCWVWTGQSVV